MDREKAIKLVQNLQAFLDCTANYINQYSIYPEKESPGKAEIENFPRPESVHTAHAYGTTLVETAADHVMALVKTVTEPAQAFAPWVCLRSALECSALAYWVLDNQIIVRTRVQRGFALRYKGLTQQLKVARAMEDNEFLDRINARIDHVEQDALKLGYDKVVSKNNNRIGIAIQMPTLTEIVRDTINAEGIYRYLSAVTHAHHWAIKQVGFQVVDEKKAGISTMPNTKVMEKSLSASSVADLCQSATIFLSKPIWQKSRLFGWDMDQLDSILQDAFRNMSIDSSIHSWISNNQGGSYHTTLSSLFVTPDSHDHNG